MAGTDKQSVVQEIRSAYREFMDAVEGLGDEQLHKPFLGSWSVREITGHIIGWQEQLTAGFERMARGERPAPEGVDWSDVQSWNEQFAAAVRERTGRELVDELDSRVEGFIAALQTLPDDRFGEGKTANRMASAAGDHHLHEHAAHIREARNQGRL